MKKLVAACASLILSLASLYSLPDYLQQADGLSTEDKNNESFSLLVEKLPAAETDQERAQIYWRLSRDTLLDADDRHFAGASSDSLDTLYEKAESYADQAIALDPCNAAGYYLKACTIGRQQQHRGILASLSQLDLMRALLAKAVQTDPEFSGSWYVLGILYGQLPGWPLSVGDTAKAVSLGRKAIDVGAAALSKGSEREISFDYWTQLARHLARRNWSHERRAREREIQARKLNVTTDPIERGLFYEGIVEIPSISDRAEARQLCRFAISQLQSLSWRTPSQNNDLTVAQETLAELEE